MPVTNAVRAYSLPEEIAGSALVGGATHVDCVRIAREGHSYTALVRGGSIEDGAFVQLRVLGQPVERSLTVNDVAGFEAWVSTSEEYGVTDPDGHPSWSEGALLLWLMQEWVAAMTPPPEPEPEPEPEE